MALHFTNDQKGSSGDVTPEEVDVRLPGKGNSNSHGARPARLTITMIKWVRTSRLSIQNSLFSDLGRERERERDIQRDSERESV